MRVATAQFVASIHYGWPSIEVNNHHDIVLQIWFDLMKMRLAALSRQVITPFQGIWYRDVARH